MTKKRKKPSTNPLDVALRLAKENGLTYAELQQLETLGKVKISNGRLLRRPV